MNERERIVQTIIAFGAHNTNEDRLLLADAILATVYSHSDIGLPDGMSRDDAYIQGMADVSESVEGLVDVPPQSKYGGGEAWESDPDIGIDSFAPSPETPGHRHVCPHCDQEFVALASQGGRP